MNMENLSHFNEKINEESDSFSNPLSHNFNDSILIFDNSNNFDKQDQNIVEIGIQTDSYWLDQIKKELLSSLEYEASIKEKSSKKHPSRPATIRSQVTKLSGSKSKRKTESVVAEDLEVASNISQVSAESLPVYPERRINDEFGISLYSSSEDEEENRFDLEKLTDMANESSNHHQVSTNDEETEKTIYNNMSINVGLPATLKVSQELDGSDNTPPLTADAFLASAMAPNAGETCEFCKKPLIPIPSVNEQVESNVDQSKLFCCQEFRNLVDFALAHRQDGFLAVNSSPVKKDEVKIIDVTLRKNHKSAEELTEDKEKSERKIQERILERQTAALIAAQTARMKTRSVFEEENDLLLTRRSTELVMVRQKGMINYQLSNYQCMEDGWTIRPPTISNDELFAKEEIKDSFMHMDYNKFIHEIFGQIDLSNQCSSVGVIRQYYPDGRLFMLLFPTGSASIYYPSGNLAISIIRETIDSSMICVIQDDSLISAGGSQISGIVNSNGFGSFSFGTGETRILYNTLMGMEMHRDGSKKRQWYWDGKPHVHAPPFQPLFFSINKYISVRISSQKVIFIHFFGITRQIHINAGFRSQISEIVQLKMQTMMKLELDRFMKPLADLKSRVLVLIDKSQGDPNYPNLLLDNKWPIKPFTLAKITNSRKSTLSLSLL